jgi:uncharacterized protein
MKKIIKSIVVFLSYFLFSYLEFIPFYIFNIDYKNLPHNIKVIYLIVINTLFMLGIIYLYWNELKIYIKDFKNNWKKYLDKTLKYWYIGLAVMIITNTLINYLTPVDIPENEKAVRELIEKAPFFMFFSTAIYAPIIEEIICRKAIRDLIKNTYLFIIISGLIFGLAHILIDLSTLWNLLYIIPYGTLGSAFALAYYKTNNLLTPITLHFIHNCILVSLYIILL